VSSLTLLNKIKINKPSEPNPTNSIVKTIFEITSFQFLGTRQLITVNKKTLHMILSWVSSVQFTYVHNPMIHFNIIFPSTYQSREVVSLNAKILYPVFIFPVHATCPAQIILFDLNILIIFCEELKKWTATPPHMPLRSKYSYHPIPTKPLFVRTSLISNEKLNTVT